MIVIESNSSQNTVNYPDHISEFEVHASLYFALKHETKADIRGEVKSRGTHGLRAAKTACRFDLVVFDNKKPVCIIEVKGGHVSHKTIMHDTRQGRRYITYGIPLIVCYGLGDIQPVIEKVKTLLSM